MNASLLAALNDAERLLVAETERAGLAVLDEDAAIDLEARIRRARNKYVGQYRRAASAAVPEHGGRGTARPSFAPSGLRRPEPRSKAAGPAGGPRPQPRAGKARPAAASPPGTARCARQQVRSGGPAPWPRER